MCDVRVVYRTVGMLKKVQKIVGTWWIYMRTHLCYTVLYVLVNGKCTVYCIHLNGLTANNRTMWRWWWRRRRRHHGGFCFSPLPTTDSSCFFFLHFFFLAQRSSSYAHPDIVVWRSTRLWPLTIKLNPFKKLQEVFFGKLKNGWSRISYAWIFANWHRRQAHVPRLKEINFSGSRVRILKLFLFSVYIVYVEYNRHSSNTNEP